MAIGNINKFSLNHGRTSLALPAIALWGIVVLVILTYIWIENDISVSLQGYYLLPWAFITGTSLLSPSAYLLYKRRFDLFHPLVFGVWIYLFPAFVGGALILTFGWNNPYFLSFVEDPQTALPLSLMYVSLGFAGVVIGFLLPIGRKIAEVIDKRSPRMDWLPENVWLPGIFLVIAGFGVNLLGFLRGLVGYQRIETVEVYDGTLSFLLIALSLGNILLWLGVFQTKHRTIAFYVIVILLIALIPMRAGLLGSRSSVLLSVIEIMGAYGYSGRKFSVRQMTGFGLLAVAAMLIGVIYGTSFRNTKGSEERVDVTTYVSQIGNTLDYISSTGVGVVLSDGAFALAERVENLSSLGVIVSNYEQLAPYEEAYGLKDNILNDFYSAFIPRFVWPEKPESSNPRVLADLYFNYEANSFTVTPFGDLLRNFGPIGIPIGMALIGIYLRIIYGSLIETKFPAMWKTVAYFPLLTVVSYEAFYGPIFPSVLRIVVVVVLCMSIANILVKLIPSGRNYST